jgi:DNA-binding MarR family transcriptional regulator
MFELRDLPNQDTLQAMARRIPELDPPSVEACLLTLRVAGDMLKLFDAFLARYGLTQGRFSVMMILFRAPRENLTPSVLATKAGVTRATMTGLLDGLEREGLALRRQFGPDRRCSLVRLTPKGRRMLKTVLPEHYMRVRTFMSALSTSDKTKLVEIMVRMRRSAAQITAMSKKGKTAQT